MGHNIILRPLAKKDDNNYNKTHKIIKSLVRISFTNVKILHEDTNKGQISEN